MVGTEGPVLDIPRVPEHPPRRRFSWLLAAVLALALALAGTAVVLANYQPVYIGNGAAGSTVPAGRDDPDGTVMEFRYLPGGQIVITRWLFNSGPWGVTVTGVDMGPVDLPGPLLHVADVGVASDSDPANPAAARPLHPLALRPGDHVGIQFVFRIRPCIRGEAGSTSGRGLIFVHFRVAGVSRTETFSLEPGVQVVVPEGTSCTASP